jgi:protein-disulfide isomerase
MRKVLAGALLVLVFLVAGCGGGSVSPGSGGNGPTGGLDTAGPTGSSNDGSGDGPTLRIASETPSVGDSSSATALHGASDVEKLLKGIPQNGLVLGDPNAPVTLIEYVDLQCPICQQFESTEFAPLVEKYVRAGKLKIEMQPWAILDRSSDEHDSTRGQKATIAAGAQNKAFNFAQVLYDNQGVEGTGWLNDQMISNIAASVDGLEPYQLATDANSAATQSVIKSINNWANSHSSEMVGTPTLYLAQGSGAPQYYKTGVPDLGSLEAAIDDLLK